MKNSSAKLIVGLGNPGSKYAQTRHNLGFLILDALIKEKAPSQTFSKESKFESEMASFVSDQTKYILAKPTTFMNLSGQAVQKIMAFYNVELQDLLIIHDDLDLPFGKIRYSRSSGPAGHNGVKSLIESLGTKNFTRLRYGIMTENKPTQMETADFVLQNFSLEELAVLEKQLPSLIQAIDMYFQQGFDKAATLFNS